MWLHTRWDLAVEACVGGRWCAFDAMQPVVPAVVAIGYGRDAADVAVYN